MNNPLGVTMGVRLLIASASLLLMSALPAAADWDRGWGDQGWDRGGRHYQADGLRRACNYGDRRACIQLGAVIGRHREARRQRDWREDRFAMPNRYYEERSRYYRPPPPPPPPPSMYWRFESR
jgi:hypothetical protein